MTKAKPPRTTWVRQPDGSYFHRGKRLVIWRSPDDDWWYVMEADGRGGILPGRDALGWARSLVGAKWRAQGGGVNEEG